MLISVCFFSVTGVMWQKKFFLNVLLLFEFLLLRLVMFCICGGLVRDRAMVGYIRIVILCLDARASVLGLALLVNSSRMARNKRTKSFSFLVF